MSKHRKKHIKDLSELLKGSVGETFYCTLMGDMKLAAVKIDVNEKQSIFLSSKYAITLDKYGRLYEEGECVLFPSKNNRDWNTYTPKLPIDTPVMVLDNERGWILRYSAGEPKKVFVKGGKSTDNVDKVKYGVVIPVENFDFENPIEKDVIYGRWNF